MQVAPQPASLVLPGPYESLARELELASELETLDGGTRLAGELLQET